MSCGFVTEKELEEQRQLRQKEWERVRNSDEPQEAPEKVYDSKCLYEKLQEQKQKKDFEYEEAHRFKNLVKGLDEDDIEFLDYVDETKSKLERQKWIEDRREIQQFRARKAQESKEFQEQQPTISSPLMANSSKKASNQQEILKSGSIVVRKRKLDHSESSAKRIGVSIDTQPDCAIQKGALKCVGILPGIGNYFDSDDSSDSNSSKELEDDNLWKNTPNDSSKFYKILSISSKQK